MVLVTDMWDDDDEESYRQSKCHHCYGWSSNCRCLNCGKQMDNDPEEEDKYELC